MGNSRDIRSARLTTDQYQENFADIKPRPSPWDAAVESSRCLFCYEAPCVTACPTGIDVPNFIRKINSANLRGAAVEILTENILGGSCARVCPTEILCEQACVRNTNEERPVSIGSLQRYATDHLMETANGAHPFERAALTGKKVAVVGAGPAGLSCAHRLALHGHDVTIFEANAKPGGLNEYGIATYKMVDDFAQRETEFVLGVGGIAVSYGIALGRDKTVAQLSADYDAVFLGIGLGDTNGLGLDDENADGVVDAVAFIRDLRQANDPAALPIGRRVIVIGGGNTAIDAAIQAKALGAEDVTMVYRRGPEQIGATDHELDLARSRDVKIRFLAAPQSLTVEDGAVCAVTFERTIIGSDGKVAGTGETYSLDADTVLKAIGQTLSDSPFGTNGSAVPKLANGRIRIDDDYKTSMPNVFAAGDCVRGLDLTVEAVQGGKLAAEAINRNLQNI